MRNHVAAFFGLSDQVNISTTTSSPGKGGIKLNGILVEGSSAASHFKGVPYSVEAVAEPGYRFKNWEITSRQSTFVKLIQQNGLWKYSDTGGLPDVLWPSEVFVDDSWAEGLATLGYGEGNEQTVINDGGNPDAKFITTYFRKTIQVSDTIDFSELKGKILVDDGAVVYLNGVEVFRVNMPDGAPLNNTLASTNATENVYLPFTIPKGVIKIGTNVFAVEVHQVSQSSSDVKN
jgi:hypothetical protein